MTGSCTAKNTRTAWVLRGCRGMGWKTWGHQTKYIAAQIQLKTKCMIRQNTVARIQSRKTVGSLPLIYYVMCFTFSLKIFPWIKCIMFSPVVILCVHLRQHCFNFDMHWCVILCKISRNEKVFFTTVSNTEKTVEKRGDSRVFFNKLWCVLKP